jgi:hypothetical protein
VVIDELRLRAPLEQTTLLTLRAAHASYQVHVLPEGYALVLILSRAAGFGGWRRAVTACCIALAEEASWSWNGRVPSPRWYVARVSTDARRRPATLLSGGSMRALEVLGAVASGMAPRERGWRVRLETGVEATLVREPGGGWYVDDPGALAARGPPRRIKSR